MMPAPELPTWVRSAMLYLTAEYAEEARRSLSGRERDRATGAGSSDQDAQSARARPARKRLRNLLAYEFAEAELNFERQLLLPLRYAGIVIEQGYRLDLLVMRKVVIEIKTVDKLVDVYRAQLLSYLKLGGYRLGYLLNFNVSRMRVGIVRMANGL